MPELNGLQALALIKMRSPRTSVLILTMHKNLNYLKEAVRRGASGYIIKDEAFDRLLWAIDEIRAGGKAFSSLISVLAIESPGDALESFSTRQREILRHASQGLTSKQIGEKLGLSVRTIEKHRAKIMKDMGISTTAGFIKLAISSFPE